ncbi:MAG: hypothetical protein AAF530_25565, partial [Pseudomonadota bacterium]
DTDIDLHRAGDFGDADAESLRAYVGELGLTNLDSLRRYDEPKTLPYSINRVCPTFHDGVQFSIPESHAVGILHGGAKENASVRR